MNNRKSARLKFLACIAFFTVIAVSLVIPSMSVAEKKEVEWEYGGAANPTRWGELSSEFESCEIGRNQSPINVNFESEDKEGQIEFDYQSSAAEVIDNGHTIEVGFEPGNSVNINGKTYELLQFHFHTPSEHQLEDESSAMELHLVHQDEAGKLAVVGVMMDAGDENSVIASLWDAIPTGNKAEQANQITLNPTELLPDNKTFVNYSGSLTTPPCSEQVSWNLLLEPIELSAEQVKTFGSIYSYNARPIQDTNGRMLKLYPDN